MNDKSADNYALFSRTLADAAKLLESALESAPSREISRVQSLPSLLERCDRLCQEAQHQSHQPIRSIHHLACTGSTLISKCVALMPNTQLLSEVDPLSELSANGSARRFSPTDLIYRIGDTRLIHNTTLITEVFIRGLSAIYDHCCNIGSNLVIRDHSHSHFCTTVNYSTRLTLKAILSSTFPTLSILTVRHPLDSFLSLQACDWIHFSPPTLQEYSRRYVAFLNAYSDCARIKYEDFVADPERVMRQICNHLALPYAAHFLDAFETIALSGDSGRKGGEIKLRARRDIPASIAAETETSELFQKLCAELGYYD